MVFSSLDHVDGLKKIFLYWKIIRNEYISEVKCSKKNVILENNNDTLQRKL